MKTKLKVLLAGLAILVAHATTSTARAGTQSTMSQQDVTNLAVQSIVNLHDRIEKEGFENLLQKAVWPKPKIVIDDYGQDAVQSFSDNPSQDCLLNPAMAGCSGAGTNDWSSWSGGTDPFGNSDPFGGPPGGGYDQKTLQNMQLKDDGIQILATEVLYQTLTYYHVKHVFGKIKQPNTWGFKVIDPVPGGDFQDLGTDGVLGAIKQFRKYVIGLLCNNPDPGRVLAMMKRYDVGTRFRWDMAWALLGNELPDAPNKYMRFGVKWRMFSMALDGIQNGSMMSLFNSSGGFTPFDPAPFQQMNSVNPVNPVAPSSTKTGKLAYTGYIANEVIGVIRLVGDVISATMQLFCVSDLSVNQKAEAQKAQAVAKLLQVKKDLYGRYAPMQSILDEMGKKATQQTGIPTSFTP